MYVYYSLSFGAGFLALVVFFILQWLQIPAGNLIDWLIGVASFYWLLAIVTIPWNVYFDAKEVIVEAAISQDKNIPVDPKQINYVQQVAKWSIAVAIALHLISAIILYLLAFWGISMVGYITSLAALLLTFLRPAMRGYQYLATRLSMIRKQIKYPREDVVELRGRVKNIELQVTQLQQQLNLNNPKSFASIQQEQIGELKQKLLHLTNSLEQLININQREHEELLRESQNAIAQLTEDSQFLGHVKEIIRFVKTA
jgi:xanthosine utilization system XapX-like protein